ncbi:MAG: tetratricopeptide repeat protein [Treponema sp.]|jgi:tetratricopeptide (TPR) repeat protein|nr:tetratricopeptide repeat protein [Treponema sp.]
MKIPPSVSVLALCFLSLLSALGCVSCLTSARAEEFYALGTAYFDLKKYDEAEKWFGKAKFHRRTRNASEYNLGRIAYEKNRYGDALRHFEWILGKDPKNVMALRAAAYAAIKNGDLEKAETYYDQVLTLVPESYDEGYNYALVLMALDKAPEAEAVLVKYKNAENADALYLLARAQKKQGKPEAADTFRACLLKSSSPRIRFDYGEFLEEQGFYAKALNEYKRVLDDSSQDKPDLSLVKFRVAAARLKGDSVSTEGIAALREALTGGFKDQRAIDGLLASTAVSEGKKTEIRKVLGELKPEEPEPGGSKK